MDSPKDKNEASPTTTKTEAASFFSRIFISKMKCQKNINILSIIWEMSSYIQQVIRTFFLVTNGKLVTLCL